MSLGNEVERAMSRTESERTQLRVYECASCGRAFARDHDVCPACDGEVDEIILR